MICARDGTNNVDVYRKEQKPYDVAMASVAARRQ